MKKYILILLVIASSCGAKKEMTGKEAVKKMQKEHKFEGYKKTERMIHRWQGDPVRVEYGYAVVEPNKRPLYWYNYEIHMNGGEYATIPAIRVFYLDVVFVISNHFGIGSHKLLNGGWPDFQHFSFDKCEFLETGGGSVV